MDSQKLFSGIFVMQFAGKYWRKKIEIESPAEAILMSLPEQFGWHVTASKLILIAVRALRES